MSLTALRKRIKDDQKKNRDLIDAVYPPTLTGANATTFADRQRSIKQDCVDILALGTFAGVTPVARTQPSGTELIHWLDGLAADANALLDQAPIPSGDLQTAANGYATIRDESDGAVNHDT